VTGSGDVPVDHPGLTDDAIPVVIATTDAGAARLRTMGLARHVRVQVAADGAAVSGPDLATLLAGIGARLVLSEGGPHLLGELLAADLLDELFLTLSPQLVGRDGEGRLGLVEGVTLGPRDGRWQELQSVRRSDDHLFFRYRRAAADPADEEPHDA
jgi:riboflavin biosynthesis pyrimidine reductase